MYEIWLMLNIVYEIALGIWPGLLAALLVWLVLLVLARKRFGAGVLRPVLAVGTVVAAVLFFSLPMLTHSAFANLGYWLDWVILLAISLGLGLLIGVFTLPLLALLRPAKSRIAA